MKVNLGSWCSISKNWSLVWSPWPCNNWTCGNRQDIRTTSTHLLLASNAKWSGNIRSKLREMSTKQMTPTAIANSNLKMGTHEYGHCLWIASNSSSYDVIVVLVDKLSKMIHIWPITKNVMTLELARIYLKAVYSHHGMSKVFISDSGMQFTSMYWKAYLVCLKPNWPCPRHTILKWMAKRNEKIIQSRICYGHLH